MMGFRQLLKYPNQKMTLKKVSGGRRLLLNEPTDTQTDDFVPSWNFTLWTIFKDESISL